jgi:DNA-binding NarL/FixJ family response regulator
MVDRARMLKDVERMTMAGCRVYICDDSPDYRLLLRMVLADVGATVVGEGCDGQECVDEAAQSDPTLVLLDLNMPGRTGLEALPDLRASLPKAKIVVLTTSKAAETERAALMLGADAFVSKPMDATDVPELLREKLAA